MPKRSIKNKSRKIRVQVVKRGGQVNTNPKGLELDHFGGFPVSRVCNLRYNATVVLTATTGSDTFESHIFRANGIFDPDYTGVGHQPLGRDIWATVYTRYLVLRSTITIYPAINGTATTPAVCVLSLGRTTPATSSLTTLAEQGASVVRPLLATAGQQYSQLRHSFSARSWFATSSPESNPELDSTSGANPFQQAYFSISVGSPTTSVAQSSVIVNIDYTVLWRVPTELYSS